jgi:hypothetical protein
MTYNEWKPTPWWLRWRGKYVRSRYASAMIGGGWDGWEFSTIDPANGG